MKSFIAPSYTFTPGASGVGTVNLSGISGFDIKYLVAVINQTRGVVIYSTGDTATRYTNLSGTTLTLNVDTSTHNSGDVLQVIYEVTSSDPLTNTQLRASAVPVSIGAIALPTGASTLAEQQTQTASLGMIQADADESVNALEALRMAIQSLTRTVGQVQPDTAARMRVAIDAISASLTLATVTTVGTVTTVSTVTTCSTLTNQTQIGGLSATEQIPSLMRLGADSMRRNISVT